MFIKGSLTLFITDIYDLKLQKERLPSVSQIIQPNCTFGLIEIGFVYRMLVEGQ